jgi:hypothetical protein
MICDVFANPNRVGRVSATNTQPNRTRTCLYAIFYQSRGTTFEPIFSTGSRRRLGPLTDSQKQVIKTLELVRIETLMRDWPGFPGRPLRDRAALARAFVAKAVMGLPATSMLIERLAVDKRVRRLCGWECPGQVPSESIFSRAFAEFATCKLPSRVHEALIKRTLKDRLVGQFHAIRPPSKPARFWERSGAFWERKRCPRLPSARAAPLSDERDHITWRSVGARRSRIA